MFQQITDVHSHDTILSRPGGIFTTHYNTVRFGIKSITAFCVRDWNELIVKCPTYSVTDENGVVTEYPLNFITCCTGLLKNEISDHFLNSYNP